MAPDPFCDKTTMVLNAVSAPLTGKQKHANNGSGKTTSIQSKCAKASTLLATDKNSAPVPPVSGVGPTLTNC
jgi:hypothetical protein